MDLARRAEMARRAGEAVFTPERLLGDVWDVVSRLRALVEGGGSPELEWDPVEHVWASPERVSTGARPGSKPPCHVGAIDQADREVMALVAVADVLGIPVYGPLWRVNGEVRGLLGGDLTELSRLAGVLSGLIAWGMLDAVRFGDWERVRADSLRMLPGMKDSLLDEYARAAVAEGGAAQVLAESRGEFDLFG